MKRLFLVAVVAGLMGCAGDELTSATSDQTNGSETRNGGYGVRIDGEIVSLDLALRGVQNDMYRTWVTDHRLAPDVEAILNRHLERLVGAQQPPAVVVRNKLAELQVRIAEQGLNYPVEHAIRNMDEYTWLRLDGVQCQNIHDDNTPFPDKIQVAYREEIWIRFCSTFNQMDSDNKAALILHEIFYAASDSISKVRELVGFIFSRDYEDFSRPAQREFALVLNKLTEDVKAGDRYFRASSSQRSAFDAAQLGLPSDRELCVARGESLSGPGVAVWLGATTGDCATGVLLDEPGQVLFTMSGEVLRYDGLAVGRLNENGDISELCTAEYVSLCGYERSGRNWLFTTYADRIDIFAAAQTGSLARVRYLVEVAGVDPDSRNSSGDTAIELAANAQQFDVVGYLAEQGANVNSTNLVKLAVQRGWVELLRAIYRAPDFDVNRKICVFSGPGFSTSELPCLYYAVWHSDYPMVELFLEHPNIANLEGTLNYAMRNDDLRMITLISSHPDFDPNGRFLLHEAIDMGRSQSLQALVGLPGIELNAEKPREDDRFNSKFTAMRLAAEKNDLVALQILVNAGADVNPTHPILWVAMQIEQGSRDLRAARILVNSPSFDVAFSSSLHRTIKGEIEPLFDLLLSLEGIDLEYLPGENFSYKGRPLFFAVEQSRYEPTVASYALKLIEAGADVNVMGHEDRRRMPVISLAVKYGLVEVVEQLIAAGADVNANDEYDRAVACYLEYTQPLPVREQLRAILDEAGAVCQPR